MEASEKSMEARPGWHEEAVVLEMRHGATQTFMKRISIGAVVAGGLIALAAQLIFIAFGNFLDVGSASVATLADLNSILTSIGIWVAVSAVIAAFIGAYATARLAGTTQARNGIWHGVATWGLLIVAGVVLAIFDFSTVLGFGISASQLVAEYVPNIGALTTTDLAIAADISGTMSGWFLVGALGSLVTAIFGGWVGGMRLSRRMEVTLAEEEERPYHRAA